MKTSRLLVVWILCMFLSVMLGLNAYFETALIWQKSFWIAFAITYGIIGMSVWAWYGWVHERYGSQSRQISNPPSRWMPALAGITTAVGIGLLASTLTRGSIQINLLSLVLAWSGILAGLAIMAAWIYAAWLWNKGKDQGIR